MVKYSSSFLHTGGNNVEVDDLYRGGETAALRHKIKRPR